MKSLKLCRIIYEFPPTIGGSIIHTIELARQIAPFCEQQIFIVPKIREDTSKIDASFPFKVYRVGYFEFKWLEHVKSKYIKWLPLAPLVNFSFALASLNKCVRLNKQFDLDIIHIHGIGIAPVAKILKYLTKKPVVIMIDGSQGSYSTLAGIFESILIKTTKFDHYFVVDNGGPALPKFQKLIHDSSKLTPVFINIDTDKIYPKRKNLDLTNHLGLDNYFVFISIHNLESIQGVDYSILGFKKFLEKYNILNSILLVVGSGSIRDKLETMTHKLEISDKVIFTGAIENSSVPDYYSISDVALSTSLLINMNTSTVEAMACKKPVIAFDCGNTRDLLIQNMQNGILITPGSIDELSESMLLLYNKIELRLKLGENARKFVVEHRNWKHRIDTEIRIYNKLVKYCDSN